MPKIDRNILRILDANLNRAKEGLRVCEDTLRFAFNSEKLTKDLKEARHKISDILKLLNINLSEFLKERDILRDVGKINFSVELKRKDISDVFFANLQRIKESIRVLEEFSKLLNKKAAVEFKKIRYRIYQLEKEAIKKFPALFNPR